VRRGHYPGRTRIRCASLSLRSLGLLLLDRELETSRFEILGALESFLPSDLGRPFDDRDIALGLERPVGGVDGRLHVRRRRRAASEDERHGDGHDDDELAHFEPP